MIGIIKWIRSDGDGYILHDNNSYLFNDIDLLGVIDRGDKVWFEYVQVIDKKIAFNIKKEN